MSALRALQRGHRRRAVVLGQGEGDVGLALGGRGRCSAPPCRCRSPRRRCVRKIFAATPGLVGHGGDRDLRLAAFVRDAGDQGLFHRQILHAALHDGAVVVVVRGPDVHRDAVPAGVLDAAQHQHLRAGRRHLEHFLVGDGVQLRGVRHDPRVGGEDAVDVGVDLADVGVQRRGQRDGGGVRAAAAERGDVLGVLADALEAGDQRDVPLVQRGPGSGRG